MPAAARFPAAPAEPGRTRTSVAVRSDPTAQTARKRPDSKTATASAPVPSGSASGCADPSDHTIALLAVTGEHGGAVPDSPRRRRPLGRTAACPGRGRSGRWRSGRCSSVGPLRPRCRPPRWIRPPRRRAPRRRRPPVGSAAGAGSRTKTRASAARVCGLGSIRTASMAKSWARSSRVGASDWASEASCRAVARRASGPLPRSRCWVATIPCWTAIPSSTTRVTTAALTTWRVRRRWRTCSPTSSAFSMPRTGGGRAGDRIAEGRDQCLAAVAGLKLPQVGPERLIGEPAGQDRWECGRPLPVEVASGPGDLAAGQRDEDGRRPVGISTPPFDLLGDPGRSGRGGRRDQDKPA